MANPQLADNQKVPYAVFELDSDGSIAVPGSGDSVAVVSSAPASLTVNPDANVDPTKVPTGVDATRCLQTGFLFGGTTAAVGVQVTATFTHTDGSAAPPPVVDLIDVVTGAPVTGSIALGVPVAQ